MFIAYSNKLHDIVKIEDAYDLNEIFSCPNPRCTAKFTIQSVNGKRAKHFGRLPSTPHIPGCDYENSDSRYTQPSLQSRAPLASIFEDNINPGNSQETGNQRNTSSSSSKFVLRINTPNKLLKFCRMNDLKTIYEPGIRVDDIILDNRNLIAYGRFRGIEGYRIVIGETVRYSKDKLYLRLSETTHSGKTVYLNIEVTMDNSLMQYICKHIIDTQGKFGGYSVAVFGKWKTDSQYHISCTVTNRKHIILKV